MYHDFKAFQFSSFAEVRATIQEMALDLPLSQNLSILSKPVAVGPWTIPNALACHPMEGSDANLDGSPGPLTVRRYERFASGGAGLIWFEAVAVVPEGRASARQLAINDNNLSAFTTLVSQIRKTAAEAMGAEHEVIILMQLTHSGRFSKPDGQRQPIIACHNPILDERCAVDDTTVPITDMQLETLEEQFVKAALLAQKAGFDGVDIKACHRYLVSELLSAYTRPGRYGETFEGRTRFILNVTERIQKACGPTFLLGARINLYDGIPYPYGFGVDKEDVLQMDASEPLELARLLHSKGVRLLSATMGTPYYNPHVNRPYDKGGYQPDEHPLVGVERLLQGAATIQKAVPGLAVVGTGYSWLREYAPYLAAGVIETRGASLIGFGREAFAYPDFARDILFENKMYKQKCCITCGKCAEILRAGGTAGCVIKDSVVYGPIYKEACGETTV